MDILGVGKREFEVDIGVFVVCKGGGLGQLRFGEVQGSEEAGVFRVAGWIHGVGEGKYVANPGRLKKSAFGKIRAAW